MEQDEEDNESNENESEQCFALSFGDFESLSSKGNKSIDEGLNN